jgi:hypothetical protein
MAKLKSEIEVACPCCRSSLVIDVNQKGRDDALARRFEEALKQANVEPITKPLRDFDLD